ncbi:MAG: hypothetical protein XXXJIFNMEKO3_02776 [Candidatus Erwinia impunctatus]|nr:hypothetical protein XXXJIFNMEKO_02776 [Culicoides impunctatus]
MKSLTAVMLLIFLSYSVSAGMSSINFREDEYLIDAKNNFDEKNRYLLLFFIQK